MPPQRVNQHIPPGTSSILSFLSSNRTLNEFVVNPWLALTPILAIALAFRTYDLDAITLLHDEHRDLPPAIAHGERLNPFDLTEALARDAPSQARLPYYLSALAVKLFTSHVSFWVGSILALGLTCGVFGLAAPTPIGRWAALLPLGCTILMVLILGWPRPPSEQIVAARMISAVFGTFGVLVTYLLGREVYGHWAGLFAAATLAVSTLDIGFNRCAATSGDTFAATFFVLATWLLYRSLRQGDGQSMMACAAAYGLAVGGKLSAVLLWLIAVIYLGIRWALRAKPAGTTFADTQGWRRLKWASVLHCGLLVPLIAVFFWPALFGQPNPTARFEVWLAALSAYLIGLAWLTRSTWSATRGHQIWAVLNICVGGVVAAAFCTPFHLRVEVIGGLFEWWGDWAGIEGTQSNAMRDALDVFKVLLVRLKTPVNFLAAVGVVWALRRRNIEWGSLILITIAVYMGAVAVLTWKTLNYLMQLLPLAHVLAGVAAVDITRRLRHRNDVLGIASGAVLCALVIAHLLLAARIHPHYLLDRSTLEKYLSFEGQLMPTAYHTQPLRPGVSWLAQNADSRSHVVVFFPAVFAPKIQHQVLNDLLGVVQFEVRRTSLVQAKQITIETTADPDRVGKFDYVFLLCCHPGWLGPRLSGYSEVHQVSLNGKTYAWIFHRKRAGTVPALP